ncbi:hypothetical protein ACFE04_026693 [Oxalis oulophora]
MLTSSSSSSSTTEEDEQHFSITTSSGTQQPNSSSSHRLWALAGVAQLTWGIYSFRKGKRGSDDFRLMPLKAFAVASLFVGSAASASMFALRASGIHKVEDLIEMGANIRTNIGVPPRTTPDK